MTVTPERDAVFAAVDLGATSGRVITGRVGPERLALCERHRFAHVPVRLPDGLRWDVLGLYREVLVGLRAAARGGPVASVGIDSWAVDYGLLDADGSLLGLPFHYRDGRNARAAERVLAVCGARELYAVSGVQYLPFNTVFQLAAHRAGAQWGAARTVLMIPDLMTYWLTGSVGAEITNASTTGLFDASAGGWSDGLMARLGLERSWFPSLREPGDPAGTLLPHVASETGLPAGTPVTIVASHDTASAVAAVPATGPGFAYVSCGTWSLAGLELTSPVLTEASRAANFTNERGIDGTVRYLRNIMGMWLLEECRRSWERRGGDPGLRELLSAAARARPFAALVDPDDEAFLAPDDMVSCIDERLAASGQVPPDGPGGYVRCVLESLALAHRRTLREAASLAGREVARIHMVGGGSRNELLCQWTADATGLPVTAGPAEATALGNILVQARARGLVGDLTGMRQLVSRTQELRHYVPQGDQRAWDGAAARLHAC
ncbi:rhamnulokinase family protein [Streptomyces sp. NPDC092952]|uniref:rhamnulokinase n=1 Tax=Streptomyces sp. NPDC092952 TaxID=3366018 RepID=UPI0037FC4B2A